MAFDETWEEACRHIQQLHEAEYRRRCLKEGHPCKHCGQLTLNPQFCSSVCAGKSQRVENISLERRTELSRRAIVSWANPEIRERRIAAIRAGQKTAGRYVSKVEIAFFKVILKPMGLGFFHNSIRDDPITVGPRQLVPDYMHENQKIVMELFGDFWHQDKLKVAERIAYYEEQNHPCLNIWESEAHSCINFELDNNGGLVSASVKDSSRYMGLRRKIFQFVDPYLK